MFVVIKIKQRFFADPVEKLLKPWVLTGVLLGFLAALAGTGLLVPSIDRYAIPFLGVFLWPVWCTFGLGMVSLLIADRVLKCEPENRKALILKHIGGGVIYAIPALGPVSVQFINEIAHLWGLKLTFTP
ncbi:hypothetical protein [Microbulbifer hainanensis]|uniref:hypothetical protein n=1 Tax=Microbulbifer hainanensis TaxID=2735675 RepID=UPI001866D4D9|nr:hypothetical protein [Microbulbifer hainanensis]